MGPRKVALRSGIFDSSSQEVRAVKRGCSTKQASTARHTTHTTHMTHYPAVPLRLPVVPGTLLSHQGLEERHCLQQAALLSRRHFCRWKETAALRVMVSVSSSLEAQSETKCYLLLQ